MTRILKAVDLFCGAGGTSQGAEQSGAARVQCAVNHWHVAVETHKANFPHARHINSRLDQVNPGECSKMDLLFASPECTHHSNARGGRPTSDQQRSGAWDIMRWVEYHRPSWLVIENVPEFRNWGPVGDHGRPLEKFRGRFFSAWVEAIQSAGYRVDDRLLNAADYGAATSRTRLFIVARKGNRRLHWPDPTHASRVGGELPGMRLHRWRPAAEIIDWNIPCRSVFLRKHPLRDNTLLRIEAGLRRFVEPFVVELRRNMHSRNAADPLSTITTGGGHHGVAVPFQYKVSGSSPGLTRAIDEPVRTLIVRESEALCVPFLTPNFGERDGQQPRTHAIGNALPSVTGHGAGALALPFLAQWDNTGGNGSYVRGTGHPMHTLTTKANTGIAVPYIIDVNHGENQRSPGGRLHSIDSPLKTLACSRGQAICVPFVVTYYANGKAYPVTDPLCTISTRDRAGIAYAIVETAGSIEPRTEGERVLLATMKELGVADVGFRMLANSELSLAQGFPADYIFHGNKSDVTKQIGNAVVPHVAEAITRAIAGAA